MSKRRKKQGDILKFTDDKGLKKALRYYGFREIGKTNRTTIYEDANGRRFRTPNMRGQAMDPRAYKNSSASLRRLLEGDDDTQSNPSGLCRRLPPVVRRRQRRA